MNDPVAATQRLERIFADDGPLAREVSGFRLRAQQVEFASAVLAAIERTGVLIAEAGTGTGKTFAYLVPALLAGGKVIVSTGTKTLQDQLYDRDLPAVKRALASGAGLALLKGRANYVCLQRLERALIESTVGSRAEAAWLRAIDRFSRTTASGDKAELAEVPEDSAVWMHATSTRDNCLGQECPRYKECFVMRARKNALEADVVVVNHHLFFADVMLRDEGVSELLPSCNTVILDEAHQLPDTARMFFGDLLSTGHLVELSRDARLELRAAGGASKEFEDGALKLEKAARDLRLVFREESARLAHAQASRNAGFEEAVAVLAAALEAFAAVAEAQAERSEGLGACARRAGEARRVLGRFCDRGDAKDPKGADSRDICWIEIFGHTLQMHVTPLDTGEQFRRQMLDHPRAWVLTSATLAVGEDFSHFKREIGIEDAETRTWPSPFDFASQALLYMPKGLPADPNDPAFTDAVIEAVLPVLRASGGRAFLLFATLRALRRAADVLKDRIDFPLLVQGTGSRSALLSRFRELGNAVLLGAASFWEGVDVRGDALSVVVIDKLPFAPPDDPVLAARIDALRAEGGNPFMDFQLPQAILQLKQGAGRLIRDETDRGVLMLCDPRLHTKAYGRRVRESLPPMKQTRVLADVEAFFAKMTQ